METPDTTPMPGSGPPRTGGAGGTAPDGRRSRVLRGLAFGLGGVVLAAAALVAAVVLFNLEQHPLVGAYVRERLVSSLQERLGPGATLSIGSVDVVREDHQTRVHVTGFDVRDAGGQVLLAAPAGTVTLQTMALATLRLVPTGVELENLRLAAEIEPDGRVRVGAFEPADPPAGAEAAPTMAPVVDPVGQGIGAAFAALAAVRDAVGGRLPELGLRNAALVVADKRKARKVTLSGINGTLRANADGGAEAHAEVTVERQRLAMQLQLSAADAERQVLSVRAEPFNMATLLSALGVEKPAVSGAAQVAVTMRVEADRALQARAAEAEATISGALLTVNPREAPLPLDALALQLEWRADRPTVNIRSLTVNSGANRLAFDGEVMPPAAPDQPWRIDMKAGPGVLDPLTPGDKPVALDGIGIRLMLDAANRRLALDGMEVTGPEVSARLTGTAGLDAGGRPELALDLAAGPGEARAALRVWPRFFAPKTRAWLVDHVTGGRIEQLALKLLLNADNLDLALADRPIAAEALAVTWRMNRAGLVPLDGAPPLRNLAVEGQATGRQVRVDIASGLLDAGGGRTLALSDGRFTVPDTRPDNPDAQVSLRLAGPVEALVAAARSPGLQPFVPKTLEPSQVHGQSTVDLTIGLRLKPVIAPADVRVALTGTLKNVVIDKVMGVERIENGDFQMAVDRNGLAMKGDARVFGTPASIEIKGQAKASPVATLTMTMDDAARSRKGFKLGTQLTGPVLVKFSAPISDGAGKDIHAELDFTRTAINELIPGWSKKAGQPARARASITELEGGAWRFDKLEVDASPLSARGLIELGKDGSFHKAVLSSFKLSPGDNVQVEADRTGANTRIAVRGNAFDARPFLKSLQVGSIDKANANNTEITLKTTVLSGFGGELVTNAEIRLDKRGGDLRRFDLTGRFDGGAVNARVTPGGGGAPMLTVESGDAGAFLRFFDIYSRMVGGQLALSVALGQGTQQGTVNARSFALRNEPAMKRLVSDMGTASTDGTRMAPDVARRLANARDVPFDRMTVDFTRTPGRLDVKDAVLLGPEIGGSMSGVMDFQRDRVSLTGTFVPAYSLNNMFSKVPVFGPLLGGGRNEGLFAVRYTIAGQMSAPSLSIDPLTAIAPGFLRKLIDVRGHIQRGNQQPAAQD